MYRIITNNQMCLVKYGDQIQVEYLDGQSYMDVLVKVRDYIQNGWCLETHPMTGSLKPNQTPYKSVMVSDRPVDKEEFYQQEITIAHIIEVVCEDLNLDFARFNSTERTREIVNNETRIRNHSD